MSRFHKDLGDDILGFGMEQDADLPLPIGTRVTFNNPSGIAQYDAYTVSGYQRIYNGDKAYRLIGDFDINKFGCPALPSEISAVTEEEAAEANHRYNQKVTVLYAEMILDDI